MAQIVRAFLLASAIATSIRGFLADIAKHVFQAHGVDASGHAILRKKITRSKLLPFFSSHPRCFRALEPLLETLMVALQLCVVCR